LDKINKENDEKVKLIYFAGVGRSGSTILGFIIGSAPEVQNCGELALFNRANKGDYLNDKILKFEKNGCSCGKLSNECPFWNKITNKIKSIEQKDGVYTGRQVSFRNRLSFFIKILLPFYKFPRNKNVKSYDYFLIKTIMNEAKITHPFVRYALDTSKSIHRLHWLAQHTCLDVRVIFLIRDGRGYINSRLKNNPKEYLRSLRMWIKNNFMIMRYLKKENIPYYRLSYERFCMDPEKYLRSINKFLNINILENYTEAVRQKVFHVAAGNPTRLNIKNFKGIKLDNKWKTDLPFFKRIFASIVLYPFHKLWL
jgi:hypothetical protein